MKKIILYTALLIAAHKSTAHSEDETILQENFKDILDWKITLINYAEQAIMIKTKIKELTIPKNQNITITLQDLAYTTNPYILDADNLTQEYKNTPQLKVLFKLPIHTTIQEPNQKSSKLVYFYTNHKTAQNIYIFYDPYILAYVYKNKNSITITIRNNLQMSIKNHDHHANIKKITTEQLSEKNENYLKDTADKWIEYEKNPLAYKTKIVNQNTKKTEKQGAS